MNKYFVLLLSVFLLLVSCKEESYYPKPYGFYRIEFPEKVELKTYQGNCGYSYQYPNFAVVQDVNDCNQNIYFPKFNAVLHLTSIQFDNSEKNNLFYHSEFSRKLAYEHRIKADAINELVYKNDSLNVYGVSYEIIGNVASNYQFFLTDSTHNFFRGSLYFNIKPNIDSVKPVLDYLTSNIEGVIESFDWK